MLTKILCVHCIEKRCKNLKSSFFMLQKSLKNFIGDPVIERIFLLQLHKMLPSKNNLIFKQTIQKT